MADVFMSCGCRAMAVSGDQPKCIVHLEAVPKDPPDLTGRTASCAYGCGAKRVSSISLAFFQYRPEKATDHFYCGCSGWD